MFLRRKLLRDLFESGYRIQRPQALSADTVGHYRRLLRSLEGFLGRAPVVGDLTQHTLCAWLASSGLAAWSPATLNTARARMLALSHYAIEHGYLKQVPKIPKIREPKRLPQSLSFAEVEQILNATNTLGGEIAQIPAANYWLALCLLWYWTGVRPGVPWKLCWQWVNLDNQLLYVPAEIQKQFADQSFRLHPDVVTALVSIERPSRELIFPWPWTRMIQYRWWHKLLELAGLPTNRRYGMGIWRRTHATLLHAHGGDATAALGHSSDKITRQYYLGDGGRCAADLLPRPKLPDDDPQLRLF